MPRSHVLNASVVSDKNETDFVDYGLGEVCVGREGGKRGRVGLKGVREAIFFGQV